MSAAGFARYRRPHLLADSVGPASGDAVEVRRGARVLTLTVEGDRELAISHLQQLLRGSLRPESGTAHPLSELLDEFDALGWIAEGQPMVGNVPKDIEAIIARGRQATLALDAGARCELARVLSQPVDALERHQLGAAAKPKCAEDVLVAMLSAQWSRESLLFAPMLARILGRRGAQPDASPFPPEDLRELETGIAATFYWAERALRAPTPLPAQPPVRWRGLIDAGVALRESEAMLRDWNAAAPESAILAPFRSERQARRIAQGIHLQQYHVSLMYAKSVLPMLARNPPPQLRALLWRYLQEELGHEDYELAACVRLGLREEQVKVSVPLPAFSSFYRLMAYAAAVSPVAWAMALPLAEGLPNERKPLPTVLARHGLDDPALAAHVDLDEAMDHSWIARRFVDGLGRIDAQQWRHATALVGAIWCATRIGWEQLVARFAPMGGDPISASPWDWRRLG